MLTATERDELEQLRLENKQLRLRAKMDSETIKSLMAYIGTQVKNLFADFKLN